MAGWSRASSAQASSAHPLSAQPSSALARGTGLLSSTGPVLVALAGCAVAYVAGWRGTDWAAQVYRSGQVAHWGFITWDPGWYGGTYPLNYSVLYPLAAGYLGLWLVAGVSAAGAAFCFDRLAVGEFGRRPAGSWYFAISTVIEVAIGQLPTLAGEALALGSVLCLARYRQSRARPTAWLGTALALGVMAGVTTPVVGAFLALALGAWALADLRRAGRRVVVMEVLAAALVFVATAAAPLLYPGPGYFPFPFSDLIVVLAICALLASPLPGAALSVRVGAVLYGAASIGLFAVRTQMGDNDARFAAYIGVPLIICYLPGLVRRVGRLVAVTVAALLVVWHWTPIVETFDGAAGGPSSTAAYYEPLVNKLVHLDPAGAPVRVEIPPTVHHWESAYVAPRFPLARGWERQLDMAYDSLFYAPGPLRPSAYRSWLLANGVSYVALANAPLDYAGTAEAALLRSGKVKGLQPVWRSANWQLWKVAGSPGLVSGRAAVSSLTPRSVVVRVAAPGRDLVRVRWSRYWSLGSTAAQDACISRAPGGWTELSSSRPGEVALSLSLFNADHGHCGRFHSVRS